MTPAITAATQYVRQNSLAVRASDMVRVMMMIGKDEGDLVSSCPIWTTLPRLSRLFQLQQTQSTLRIARSMLRATIEISMHKVDCWTMPNFFLPQSMRNFLPKKHVQFSYISSLHIGSVHYTK